MNDVDSFRIFTVNQSSQNVNKCQNEAQCPLNNACSLTQEQCGRML